MDDRFDLRRFVAAQEDAYDLALRELRAGRKAQRYAISTVAEAEAYLAHPVLGPRLAKCCEAVLGVVGRTAYEIMGPPDDLKLRSCATLFAHVAPAGSVFERVLDKYYEGKPDQRTLELMALA
jgi:uncharacterized protein (DUF1810 family)